MSTTTKNAPATLDASAVAGIVAMLMDGSLTSAELLDRLMSGTIDRESYTAVLDAYTAAKVSAASAPGGKQPIPFYRAPSGSGVWCMANGSPQRPLSQYPSQWVEILSNAPAILTALRDDPDAADDRRNHATIAKLAQATLDYLAGKAERPADFRSLNKCKREPKAAK